MQFPVRSVVIPAAGLGTRGLPFTKEVPKELSPVLEVPALHFLVDEAVAAGIEQVVLVTSRGKNALEEYLSPKPDLERWLEVRGKTALLEMVRGISKKAECIVVRQHEPLGLGHAVECAKPVVGDRSFAVSLGDEICPRWDGDTEPPALGQLVQAAQQTKCSVVGVLEVPKDAVSSYGIVDVGGVSLGQGATLVRGAVEKPAPENAPSRYAIIGRYVFDAELFEELARTGFGKGGEKQLTDAMQALALRGRLAAQAIRGRRYDLGHPLSFALAQVDAALIRQDIGSRFREELQSRLAVTPKK